MTTARLTLATVLTLACLAAGTPAAAQQAVESKVAPPPGKYGCTESKPRMVNGSWQYELETRGTIVLDGDHGYTDPFGNAGAYRYDAASGVTHFTGGALDQGAAVHVATPENPHRYRVTIPTANGERRWLCGRA